MRIAPVVEVKAKFSAYLPSFRPNKRQLAQNLSEVTQARDIIRRESAFQLA